MVPSADLCGHCQSPLFQKTLRGAPLLVCTTCHTVTLKQIDFERLALVRSEDPLPFHELELEDEPTESIVLQPVDVRPVAAQSTFRLGPLIAGIGMTLGIVSVVSVSLFALAMFLRPPPTPTGASVQPRSLDDHPILPFVKSDGVPVPAPPPDPAPKQSVSTTQPEAPHPPPSPRAAPQSPGSAREWALQGWSTVDRAPAEALTSFQRALAIQPGHADATYGYGYALLMSGRPIDARPHLCKALTGATRETQREIRALLQRKQLSCI